MRLLSVNVILILGITSLASAADKPRYGKAKEVHLGETSSQMEKKMDLLSKKLDLTPQQLYRVKAVLEEQSTKMDQLKKEYADAVSRIIDEADGQMKGILNPTQQDQFGKYRDDILGKKEKRPESPSDADQTHDHERGGR